MTGPVRHMRFAWALALLLPSALPAQDPATIIQRGWADFTLTAGASAERYTGNLSSVTATVVDSTESAGAAVGEFGGNAVYRLLWTTGREVILTTDMGLRQTAASGFDLRDYAPREIVASGNAFWREPLGARGHLDTNLSLRGRGITDRPPMPLFLQPGYVAVSGELRWWLPPRERVRFDISARGSNWDYRATPFAPQLDLLDRREFGLGVGATVGGESTLRFTLGYHRTKYPDQGTFDPEDPYRRDRTTQAGVEVRLQTERALVQLGLVGSLNRSNSRRPEYDAIAFETGISVPLEWQQLDLTLSSSITGKSYLTDTEFARLVPGEEADNASVVFLTASRPIQSQVTASMRLGWTRAETDIGSEYYERWGLGLFLEYKPMRR